MPAWVLEPVYGCRWSRTAVDGWTIAMEPWRASWHADHRDGGWQAGCSGFFPPSCPCIYPAGKDGVLQGPRERQRKQEVTVAQKKIRWKRGSWGFALCFQEGLDKALVGGMKITHSLLCSCFWKVSWERSGETGASSRTGCCYDLLGGRLFICSHCHTRGGFSPRAPLAPAYLCRAGVPAPCAHAAVPRGVCSSVFLGVCLFVPIYLFIFMGVYISVSIPETFGEAG